MRTLFSLLFLFAFCPLLFAEIRTEPLPESCALSLIASPETKTVTVRFRETGAPQWREGFPMTKLPYLYPSSTGSGWNSGPLKPLHVDPNEWRSMIGELRENTDYELEVTEQPSGKRTSAKFRTPSLKIAIGETIYLDDLPTGEPIVIDRRGKPDRWLRYTVRNPQSVITDEGKERYELLKLNRARYILLENLTLKGGTFQCVSVENSSHIRIVNCDISGFSRVDGQNLDGDGKFFKHAWGKNRPPWGNAGIHIRQSDHILIERNYIHSPASSANSWFYSHTCGPMAVCVTNAGGNIVIRWNDFIGSDSRRWDDAVGGGANGSPTGGFNRNADIYGNMFFCSNDDGIEIDGGQSNILVHRNRFECNLAGISAAPCIVGPSYLYRNLMIHPGDEFRHVSAGIKNLFGDPGTGTIHAFNNVTWSIGGGPPVAKTWRNIRFYGMNNIIDGRDAIVNLQSPCIMDYNVRWYPDASSLAFRKKRVKELGIEAHGIFGQPVYRDPETQDYRLAEHSPGRRHGVRIPNFIEFEKPDAGAYPVPELPDLPERPLPVSLDRQQVIFGEKREPVTVRAKARKSFSSPFRIRINDGVDWFRVFPSEGVLNAETVFTVTLHPEKLRMAKRYSGAFLIRFPNGLSRPVTVYADLRNAPELKAKETAVICETAAKDLENAGVYSAEGNALLLDKRSPESALLWKFNVPRDGIYYLFGLWQTDGIERNLFEFSVDGDKADVHRNPMMGGNNSIRKWRHIRRGVPGKDKYFELFRLKKGVHELRIFPKRPMRLERLGITDTPGVYFR